MTLTEVAELAEGSDRLLLWAGWLDYRPYCTT